MAAKPSAVKENQDLFIKVAFRGKPGVTRWVGNFATCSQKQQMSKDQQTKGFTCNMKTCVCVFMCVCPQGMSSLVYIKSAVCVTTNDWVTVNVCVCALLKAKLKSTAVT